MLKIKFVQRLLAVLLSLTVMFLACACVSEDTNVSQVQSVAEIKKETNTFELSEIGTEGFLDEKIAASEQIEETISTEPIEPVEPFYPEERETTLEKVLSFDIGIEGVFSYNFIFYDDPTSAHFYPSGKLYTDGKGNFYHTDEYRLIRVNDGAVFPVTIWESIDDVEIIGNTLYLLYLDGNMMQYDISKGFESPVLIDTIRLFEPSSDEKGYLQSVGKSEPVFVSDADKIYNLSKKTLTDSEIPFAFQKNAKKGDTVTFENGTFHVSYNETQVFVPFVSETTIWTKSGYSGSDDAVYALYGKNNHVLSRVLVDVDDYSENVKCELEFVHANNRYTVESYRPQTVMVGETVFDELFRGRVFFDLYGNMYFAAYYTDRCDIYIVNAGYTGESFTKEENVMAEEDSIAPMSTASADSAGGSG